MLRGEGMGVGIENGMGHGLERRMDRVSTRIEWLRMALVADFRPVEHSGVSGSQGQFRIETCTGSVKFDHRQGALL